MIKPGHHKHFHYLVIHRKTPFLWMVLVGSPEMHGLRLKFHRADLHLDLLQWVVRPVPAIPGDPVWVLHVLTIAVKNAVQVGVSTAVVPVAPCCDESKLDFNLKWKVWFWNGHVVWAAVSVTFAKGGTVIHAFVIVLVRGAEVGIIVVAQGVSGIPAVVGKEELVAVELISYSEETILGVASLAFPVLHWKMHLIHLKTAFSSWFIGVE